MGLAWNCYSTYMIRYKRLLNKPTNEPFNFVNHLELLYKLRNSVPLY